MVLDNVEDLNQWVDTHYQMALTHYLISAPNSLVSVF